MSALPSGEGGVPWSLIGQKVGFGRLPVMGDDTDGDAQILEMFEANSERFVSAQLAERSTTTIPTQEEP